MAAVRPCLPRVPTANGRPSATRSEQGSSACFLPLRQLLADGRGGVPGRTRKGGVPWSPRPLSTIFQSYLNIVLNLKCDPKAPLSKGKICGKAHYKCKFSRVESERSHKYLTFNLAIWLCVSSHSFLLLLLVLQQTSPLSHSLLLTAAEN